jgi:hypothetical protein
MGNSLLNQAKFLGAVLGISCVIAAYWVLIPIIARFAGVSQ